MKETGYITLWDVECVFAVEDKAIVIIPKDKNDIQKINSHFEDQDFIIKYNPTVGCATAFIERVEFGINQAIKLFPKYIIERCHRDLCSSFEITGEAIDDFFSPARYFYERLKGETESNVDFIYNSEVADRWSLLLKTNRLQLHYLTEIFYVGE